jgi:hypothetical protein
MDATMLAAVCIALGPGMSEVIVNIDEQLVVGDYG